MQDANGNFFGDVLFDSWMRRYRPSCSSWISATILCRYSSPTASRTRRWLSQRRANHRQRRHRAPPDLSLHQLAGSGPGGAHHRRREHLQPRARRVDQ